LTKLIDLIHVIIDEVFVFSGVGRGVGGGGASVGYLQKFSTVKNLDKIREIQ